LLITHGPITARSPHASNCQIILIVYEMKRLGRDSAELTALADHLTASPSRCSPSS